MKTIFLLFLFFFCSFFQLSAQESDTVQLEQITDLYYANKKGEKVESLPAESAIIYIVVTTEHLIGKKIDIKLTEEKDEDDEFGVKLFYKNKLVNGAIKVKIFKAVQKIRLKLKVFDLDEEEDKVESAK